MYLAAPWFIVKNSDIISFIALSSCSIAVDYVLVVRGYMDMKRKCLLGLIIVIILLASSCSKQQSKQYEATNESISNEISIAPNVNDKSADNDEASADAESEHTAIKTEQAEGIDNVIVDGYNITSAVTEMSLKEAFQRYFKFGVGLNGTSTANDTVQSAAMSEIIKHHFNSATYSNLMKPSYLLDQKQSIENANHGSQEPAVNFDTVRAGLEFGKQHHIQMRGHVLVWHNQVPDWFFREGYTNAGSFVDRQTMLTRLESYIKQVLEFTQHEYPGVIYSWDVVNEAIEVVAGYYETESGYNIRTKHGDNQDNLWYTIVGTDYVEKAFEYARKYADQDVKLFYNDYNTFQPVKTLNIFNLVSDLKEKNLIDGIGMQGYMDLNYPGIVSGNHNVADAINKFAELELEIHITELTINSPSKDEASMRRQAERYKELFELLTTLDTDGGGPANITSVTVFGVMDEYLFYDHDKNYSRLFDGKLQPKPAFYEIMSVVNGESE